MEMLANFVLLPVAAIATAAAIPAAYSANIALLVRPSVCLLSCLIGNCLLLLRSSGSIVIVHSFLVIRRVGIVLHLKIVRVILRGHKLPHAG